MIWLTVIVTVFLFGYLTSALLRPDWLEAACGVEDCMIWLLPNPIVGPTVAVSLTLGNYLTRGLDRGSPTNVIERAIDTGPQDKQFPKWRPHEYPLSMMQAGRREPARRGGGPP
jgi:K+-transporting ATPase KdpF subunit